MGVDMDGQVRVLLADGANKQRGSMGLQHTSHVLDAQNMNVEGNELVDKVQVVGQVVLLVGVLVEAISETEEHTAGCSLASASLREG